MGDLSPPWVPPPLVAIASDEAMEAAGAGIPRCQMSVARAASVSHADLSEVPIAEICPVMLGA